MSKIDFNLQRKFIVLSIISFLIFTGCATKTANIKPIKCSNEQTESYKQYSCRQLATSLSMQESRVQRLSKIQNEKSKHDSSLMSWGWALYGVPYVFLDGNSDEKNEVAVLLGQNIALENLMKQKNCKTSR